MSENALCETLFVRDDHFAVFMELVRGLLEEGRVGEARDLVTRGVALCEKRSRWGAAAGLAAEAVAGRVHEVLGARLGAPGGLGAAAGRRIGQAAAGPCAC